MISALGRYEIIDELGRGGSAKTYLARDTLDPKEVVIKALCSGSVGELQHEFSMLARLRHPNIVRVIDLVQANGQPYLVEEYLPGGNFLGWAAQQGRPAEICRGLAAALRGLQYLHAQGVVHRDLKPENIWVSPGEIGGLPAVRLIDFALATDAPTPEVSGTLGYIAPEVLAGRPIAPASDIFSLGVVLYQALYGALPNVATNPLPLLLSIPSAEHKDVLAELLRDMLHLDADKRPTATMALEGLGAVVGASLHLTREDLAGVYFPALPLIGWSEQQDRIARTIAQVKAGGAQAFHLTGSGKTTFARHVATMVRLEGLEVFFYESLAALLGDPRFAGLARRQYRGGTDQIAIRDLAAVEQLATALVDQLLNPKEESVGQFICLDDWSLADPVTVPLLGQLARAIHHGYAPRCLLLWIGEEPQLEAMQLRPFCLPPLTPEEILQLAERMLYAWSEQPGWLRELSDKVGGDAGLAVQWIRAQIEAGLTDELVDTIDLQKLLTARLSTLPPHEQQVLAYVAHARQLLPRQVIVDVTAVTEENVNALIQRGYLHTTDQQQLALAGTALQKAIQARLAPAEKKALHGQLLAVWRKVDPDLPPAIVGYHLLHQGMVSEGLQLMLAAPFIHPSDLELSLGVLPVGQSLWITVLERLASCYRGRGELDAALELARQLQEVNLDRGLLLSAELLLDAGQPAPAMHVLEPLIPQRFRHRLLLARSCFMLGNYAQAMAHVESARKLHEVSSEQVAQIENIRALSLIYSGKIDEGWALIDQMIPVARQGATPSTIARLLNSLGLACQRRGQFTAAGAAYEECFSLAYALGDLRFAATCALNLGTLAYRQLDLVAAQRHFDKALALAFRAGISTTSAWAAANAANLHLFIGNFLQAEKLLEQAHHSAQNAGNRTILAHTLLYQAELGISQQRYTEASERIDQAQQQLPDNDLSGQIAAEVVQAELYLAQEMVSEARSLGSALLQKMRPEDPDGWRAHYILGRSHLAAHPPSWAEAVRHLELSLAASRFHPCDRVWEIHAYLSTGHRLLGDDDLALWHARQTASTLQALRERLPPQWRSTFDARREVQQVKHIAHEMTLAAAGAGTGNRDVLRLLEINKQLNQQRPLSELLGQILDCAVELTGAERGFILTTKEGGLKIEASRNVDKEAIKRGMEKFSKTIANTAIQQQRTLLVSDAMDDERFMQRLSVHGLKLRAVLCVPLRDRDTNLGALYLDNRFLRGAFQEHHLSLMQAFGEQASLALKNTQLLQQIAEQREALADAKQEVDALNARLEAQLARQSQELSEVSERLRSQEEELVRRYNAAKILGRSKAMRALFAKLGRVADAEVPIFIWGETGTGKELVARAIHYTSQRREHPFVSVNCGAIPETLLEGELFGHVRGAFTGALRDRPGLFEVARHGTIFLDEVGDMPLAMQVKLLRVLQEGTYRRVGDAQERQSHCRVLSASLQRLKDLVVQEKFREDLFYRLNVIELSVPPLRERREDIPLLVRHFLAESHSTATISPAALAALVDYGWPGNVRQLENELSRAVLFGGATIELDALSPAIRQRYLPTTARSTTFHAAVEECERQLIQQALQEQQFNISLAAKQLGIHRVVLHRKIKKLNIRRPAAEPEE